MCTSSTVGMFDIKNRNVIITGAAQGLGKEFARRLLLKGCNVCLSDINESKGQETKIQFQKEFGLNDNSLCFINCDVSDKEAWTKLWNFAEKNFNGSIDILINNAGLNHTHGWERNLEVMIMGASRGVFKAIERMGKSNGGRGGRIVNVASVAGLTYHPIAGLGGINCSGYTVAKHGLVALTRAFLVSEPKVSDVEAIKCYALAPTFADTNLVRSAFEAPQTSTKAKIENMEDLVSASQMRILTVEEVGTALMKSFEYDKDGAVYAIFPDCPLIEWPNDERFRFLSIVGTNILFGKLLNIQLFTWKHFYIVISLSVFLINNILLHLFHSIFS